MGSKGKNVGTILKEDGYYFWCRVWG